MTRNPNHQARDADGEGFGLKSSALARKHVLTRHERELLAQAREIKARVAKERKAARPAKVRPTAEGQRNPRERDNGFLAFLRRQPCVVGPVGCSGPVEAAHIRFGKPGEPPTGMQRKPDDRRATPLCRGHHREGPVSQHAASERKWWQARGLDPHAVAERLYAQYRAPDTMGEKL